MLGVHADGDLVAHGAGGNKQRRLAAKDLRGACFQKVDGGVFSVNIVPYLSCGHGGAHRWGGASDGVATQVDSHWIWNSSFTPRKRAKTLLDKSTPRGVRRTRPASSVSRSRAHSSRTTGWKIST